MYAKRLHNTDTGGSQEPRQPGAGGEAGEGGGNVRDGLWIGLAKALEARIKKENKTIEFLEKKKGTAVGPRDSKSSHELQDIEAEVDIYRELLEEDKQRLKDVLNYKGKAVGVGSVIKLRIDKAIGYYVITSGKGGKVDKYTMLSVNSPIGKAVWGMEVGDVVTVACPVGAVDIELLGDGGR